MSADADDRGSSARFVRGLTLGALLGAIIAGSSLWTKSKSRRRPDQAPATPERDEARPGADR